MKSEQIRDFSLSKYEIIIEKKSKKRDEWGSIKVKKIVKRWKLRAESEKYMRAKLEAK